MNNTSNLTDVFEFIERCENSETLAQISSTARQRARSIKVARERQKLTDAWERWKGVKPGQKLYCKERFSRCSIGFSNSGIRASRGVDVKQGQRVAVVHVQPKKRIVWARIKNDEYRDNLYPLGVRELMNHFQE